MTKETETNGGIAARGSAEERITGRNALGAHVRVLLVGMFLGVVLVKSEVASWSRVHAMFLFTEAHMYLVIATGIAVAALAMLLIGRVGAGTVTGEAIAYRPKPFHKGVVIGGMIFGAGWAITGACPGPVYAQIGAGVRLSLLTWVGAMAGMYVYARLKPKLPH